MTDKGAIIPPRSLDNLPDQGKFDEKLQQNLQDHSNYWDQQNANQKYEHWRYEDGFKTAWEDSLEFAKFDGSRIGRVEFWKAARASQHISSKGSLKHVWEWYQGFDKGLQEFANN